MRKTQLAKIPETFAAVSGGDRVTRTFRFELLTPMFGGGAKSWELDETNPVRTQSIKGALRFWWRTQQSGISAAELLDRENQLWGGKIRVDKPSRNDDAHTRCKSPVRVAVVNQQAGEPVPAVMTGQETVDPSVIPAYVLFPIIKPVKDGGRVCYITKLSFELCLSYKRDVEAEVLRTVALWSLFGGVGARTRRGCGSVYCEELLREVGITSVAELSAFVAAAGLDKSAQARPDAAYPQLRGGTLGLGRGNSSDAAVLWRGLLESYGNYRQGRGEGRNQGVGPVPGRSFWPEPDSLRRITGQHKTEYEPEHDDGNWFPRAAYGLPLSFKFKGQSDPGGGKQIDLLPVGKSRWPSPLILKAIKLPDGIVASCCLLLNSRLPTSLEIRGSSRNLPHQLTATEMPLHCDNRKMKTNRPLSAGQNPYSALLKFLKVEEL